MITIVFEKPGSGKTAFLTAIAVQYLNNSRQANDLYLKCLSQVEGMKGEGFSFSLPEHSPVYSNFRILVPVEPIGRFPCIARAHCGLCAELYKRGD